MATASRPRSTALIFAGGDPPPFGLAHHLPDEAFVVAADIGLEHARVLGRTVDLAVGDFDSVSPEALADAAASGVMIERHPVEKDATDLELALDAAMSRGVTHLTVVGGDGGRLDHLLGNLTVIAAPKYADLTVTAWFGTAYLEVIRSNAELHGSPGAICSLIPVHGSARGVSTAGLRFPLHDAVLPEGSTRGVSNEFVEPIAEVSVGAGALIAILPDALALSSLPFDSSLPQPTPKD